MQKDQLLSELNPGLVPDLYNDFESSENNADIWDTAAGAVPGGNTVRGIGQAIGGLFKKEDKSTVGWERFLAARPQLQFYPTKDEMLKAATAGGWERVEPAAIVASYNPDNGTWQRGDWHFAVVSTSPIIAKAFKGSGEQQTLNSPINAVNPSPTPMSMAAATPGSPTSPNAAAGATVSFIDKYKIPLIVAGVVVIAAIIYFATRK